MECTILKVMFFIPNLDLKNPKESIHVSKLHEIILSFFKNFNLLN